MSFLRSSLVSLFHFTGDSKGLENSGFEVRCVRQVVTLKRRSDVRFGKVICLPGAIEMFEPFSGEPLLGYVSKGEVGFAERAVLVKIPGSADCEIAQQIIGGIRFERYGHQRMKELTRLCEMSVDP